MPVPHDLGKGDRVPKRVTGDIRGGHETLLVVEDEESLLTMLESVLREHGYRVVGSKNGLDALEQYGKLKDRIDLVLTDLDIPGLNGGQLLRELRLLNPRVAVVISSGFVDPHQKTELLREGVKEIISKPYEPDEFLQKIRATLDAS